MASQPITLRDQYFEVLFFLLTAAAILFCACPQSERSPGRQGRLPGGGRPGAFAATARRKGAHALLARAAGETGWKLGGVIGRYVIRRLQNSCLWEFIVCQIRIWADAGKRRLKMFRPNRTKIMRCMRMPIPPRSCVSSGRIEAPSSLC